LGKIEALVDAGCAAGAIDFEWAEEDVGFALCGLEPGEVVGDEKTGGVGKIGDVFGVADEETSDTGHG
jgi:hypothetical protein